MSTFYNPSYNSVVNKNLYEMFIAKKKLSTYIKLSMRTSHFHTNFFPATLNILTDNLPSVLKTKCFNQNNYSFDREVLNTELGHLFEHILLQYLCESKLKNGATNAVFRGLTRWNWEKDKRGTFHITLSVGREDSKIFSQALENTENLMKKILNSPVFTPTIN